MNTKKKYKDFYTKINEKWIKKHKKYTKKQLL